MTKHRIKTIGASALTAAAAMVSTGPAALAAPAQVLPPVGTVTQILNSNSNKCLTIAGGGFDNNIYANQYRCDTHPARYWRLEQRDDGNFWIVNKNSGKCLTIAGGSNADNADANQYSCDNHPARRWYFVNRGNDEYNIMNLYTGKCLTIAGGGTADNIKAVQYGCDLHRSRLWYFRY
jgi:hypothetical protein